ncbi:respiratory nitrate reductase subunit gamma [Chloroflexota bacterium]
MDWFSFLVAGILIYISVAVFLIGIAFRLYGWLRVPRSGIKLGIFPQKGKGPARYLKLAQDSFLFPQVFDVDRPMWVFVILLHLFGVFLFIGHLRLFGEFTPLANALGSRGMDQFALLTGGMVGIVLLVTVLYLLIRRFKSPFKDISTPEDYFLLILVLLVVLMGNHLRFFGDVPVTAYREYIRSLLSFSPDFPIVLANSSTKWSLVTHVLFSGLLLIYFPFSKLVHFVGAFAVNLIRSE